MASRSSAIQPPSNQYAAAITTTMAPPVEQAASIPRFDGRGNTGRRFSTSTSQATGKSQM
ncbi:MAG: hypothetical protein ACYTFF_13005 [Planctomycetota bacterium]|jgi:hypothetical protein